MHLFERFRLADESTLVITQEFRDPGSFDGTAARVLGRELRLPLNARPAGF